MRNTLLILGGIAAFGAAAPAAAVTAVTQCESSALVPTCAVAFDGTAGTYGNSAVTRTPFTDIYTVDILANGFFSVTLTSSYSGGDLRQDIDFRSFSLTGAGVNRVLTVSELPEPRESFSFTDVAVTPGQYTLTLAGAGGQAGRIGASYSGTMNFSAGMVPEPTTWAMLGLGFGLVGASLRGRRRRMSPAAL